jgi:Universal stress protein family
MLQRILLADSLVEAPRLFAAAPGTDLADNKESDNPLGSHMAESLFTKILVPVDFSPCSEEAFRVALTLARTFQAKLLLLHVIDTSTLATFYRLGLFAVPSDAQDQKRGLRHHARGMCRQRRTLKSRTWRLEGWSSGTPLGQADVSYQ